MEKNKKGFTLIEILTTIVILTLVLGMASYFIINFNNNSKDKADDVSINSIKNSSIDYVLERDKTIGWLSESNDSIEEYVCITLGALVDYGYFNKNVFNNGKFNRNDFIKLIRDKTTKSITSEEMGVNVNTFCGAKAVVIPTCNNITYNGSKQALVSNYDELKMTIDNPDIKKTDANTYKYTFSLKGDGKFFWEDGSMNDKVIKCEVKKYICNIGLANKEIRYDGLEHKYDLSELVIKGINNTVLTNYDINGVSINYYKDNTYSNLLTTVKDELTYYVKVDVNLDNYKCSKNNIILDIYNPILITLDNQGASNTGTSSIYERYNKGIYLNNDLTKKMTTSANKITIPSRTGYTFLGYYNKTSGGTQLINASGYITSSFTNTYFAKGTKDATIYARWTPKTYTVNFNANGGSVNPTSTTVTYNSTYGTLPTPTRNGYTFNGWYTAANGGNKITNSTKVTITATQTLYARWTANTYTVNLDANGGVVTPKSITVTYGNTYNNLPTPTRTNYQFLGWYTDKSSGSKITSTTKVTITATQTLYARWAKELQVGDYVSYTPSSASYNWNSNYSGYSGTYASDGFPSTTLSNENDNYKITSWRVLSINGNTVELVASSPTKGKVPLYGAQGYNNGVKLLNDACSTLYSNSSKGISARNVRLEDITSRLTSSALTEINNYVEKSYKLGTSKKYTSKRYYPVMYASEKGSIINGTTKTTGLGPSEQSSFIEKTASGATDGRLRASSSIRVTETYWYKYISFFKTAFKANGNATSSLYCDLFFPKGANTEYWLSTRFNILGDDLATFQIAYISTYDGDYDSYVGGQKLLASNGKSYWDVYEIFPLLTLNKSTIKSSVSNNITSYSIK